VSPTNPGQCLSVQQCAGNNDCPNNAFCSPEKVCVCPEPNQGPNCESKCFVFCRLYREPNQGPNCESKYFVFCRLYPEPNQGPNCESKYFVFCRLYPEPNQGPNCESRCLQPIQDQCILFFVVFTRSQTKDPTSKVSAATRVSDPDPYPDPDPHGSALI
jgi:hypothetical protein